MSTKFIKPFYFIGKGTFHERKTERTEHYFRYEYKNKLITCTACSGYRYYCGNPCGFCEGTGKQRENEHYW
ncbi:heat shock protein DnaJ [Vibrio phage 1.101.O._10N.261.45.C6]|nr:heat shock protein DnaJ [Vibrio phage 1.101.O._10N.261.45.C6]